MVWKDASYLFFFFFFWRGKCNLGVLFFLAKYIGKVAKMWIEFAKTWTGVNPDIVHTENIWNTSFEIDWKKSPLCSPIEEAVVFVSPMYLLSS